MYSNIRYQLPAIKSGKPELPTQDTQINNGPFTH